MMFQPHTLLQNQNGPTFLSAAKFPLTICGKLPVKQAILMWSKCFLPETMLRATAGCVSGISNGKCSQVPSCRRLDRVQIRAQLMAGNASFPFYRKNELARDAPFGPFQPIPNLRLRRSDAVCQGFLAPSSLASAA
jgi:hypothetical protein